MNAPASLLAVLALPSAAFAQHAGYEYALRFLGDYPAETNPGFHEDIQGVTHDDDHWFFTQAKKIWKVPVGQDLAVDVSANPGTRILDITGVPGVGGAGYNHLGVLAIGISGGGPQQLAIFRASDLGFVGKAELAADGLDSAIGVAPDGRLFTQFAHDNTQFNEYSLNWDDLDVPLGTASLDLQFVARYQLKDVSGTPVEVPYLQGMCVSPSGTMIYLANGFMSTGCWGDDVGFTEEELAALGGIRAVDLTTWTMEVKSSNGSGLFNYAFLPGYPNCEEPEGLTWWDLEDGRAPGISGTLHAILLDNDNPDADDFYFKHYTHRVHVGGGFPGEFATVLAGYNFAWEGCELVIAPGSFDESLVVAKRVLVRPLSGTVVVGD